MSKYFIDTEFLEGTQKTLFGESKPTIELISIGVVCKDGREYYAISKDFNLKEAWNRYDEKVNVDYKPSFGGGSDGHYNPQFIKVYWIRENVLKPIYWDMMNMGNPKELTIRRPNDFNYKNFKRLLNKYGKTNKQIAEEVYEFCSNNYHKGNNLSFAERVKYGLYDKFKPVFYGYYSDYDWVTFCWLFGKMIDLPNAFPMYCIDLQQIFDEKMKTFTWERLNELVYPECKHDVYDYLRRQPDANVSASLKKSHIFPKQTNEHHALMDARWTKQLYEFLDKI